MHELSLCRSIYGIVDQARSGRRVRAVNLQVGQLRQVIPETLTYCWGLLCTGGPLAGSELVVDHVPVVVGCRDCHAPTTLAHALLLLCGSCGSAAVDIVSGEEFLLTSLDLEKES